MSKVRQCISLAASKRLHWCYRTPPSNRQSRVTSRQSRLAAVTTAAAIYGTRFRIMGKEHVRSIRDRSVRHPAEKYLRSWSVDANHLAHQMETLAKEVPRLGLKLARLVTGQNDLDEVIYGLARSAVRRT
jgi:hypothetical protein